MKLINLDAIKELPMFEVEDWTETKSYKTIEEAQIAYNEIANDLLRVTNGLEKSHWNNNKEGLRCELRQMRVIPIKVVSKLNEAETQDEINEIWAESMFTYSDRLKTRTTFLSDEWSSELGEFLIKETENVGITYGTFFGKAPESMPIEQLLQYGEYAENWNISSAILELNAVSIDYDEWEEYIVDDIDISAFPKYTNANILYSPNDDPYDYDCSIHHLLFFKNEDEYTRFVSKFKALNPLNDAIKVDDWTNLQTIFKYFPFGVLLVPTTDPFGYASNAAKKTNDTM